MDRKLIRRSYNMLPIQLHISNLGIILLMSYLHLFMKVVSIRYFFGQILGNVYWLQYFFSFLQKMDTSTIVNSYRWWRKMRRGLQRPKDTGFYRLVRGIISAFKFDSFFWSLKMMLIKTLIKMLTSFWSKLCDLTPMVIRNAFHNLLNLLDFPLLDLSFVGFLFC